MGRFLSLITFLIFSTELLASPLGSWTGKGHSTNGSWWDKSCPLVSMELSVDQNKFWIKSGAFVCGEIGVSYTPFSYDFQSGVILKNGQAIGKVTENRVDLRVPREEGGFWILQLQTDETGGTVEYIDRQEEASGYFFEVSGKLHRP